MTKIFTLNETDATTAAREHLRPVAKPLAKQVRATGKVHFTLGTKAETLCTACKHPIQLNEPCLFCAALASKRAAQKAIIQRRLKHLHEIDEMQAELDARAKARGE